MVRLTISYNGEHLKTYELELATITVGRLPENTISIANMGISRRHFRIEVDSSRKHVLSDLSSLNGTYVNGSKVKSCQLNSGDTISIGKYSILFETVQRDGSNTAPGTHPPPATVQMHEDVVGVPSPQVEPDAFASVAGESAREPAEAVEVSMERPSDQGTVSARKDPPSDPPVASAVLIDTDKHTVYRIEKALTTLGSSDSDDIFVSGFLIGEGHVVIERRDDGIWVKATKLIGKFRVNGQKTKEHRLEHKDRIELGTSTFRFMENE